jgi:hypothetical protein
LHHLSSAFVLGYHGCDRDVGERLIAGSPFVASENEYDWLGSGVYFWEANPRRGLEFAIQLQRWRMGKANQIKEPFVVGAAIDPGFCLDLTTSTGIQAVASTHPDFLEYCAKANVRVPANEGGPDFVFRRLDCAVINHLHKIRETARLPPFETVRGVFIEGRRIYPESGFFEKTHVQLCVRDLSCIKGVFRVPEDHLTGM